MRGRWIETCRFFLVDSDNQETAVSDELFLAVRDVRTKKIVRRTSFDVYLCKRFPFILVLHGQLSPLFTDDLRDIRIR